MKFIIAALLSTFALAHFDVVYPDARGENEDLEDVAPCGGAALGERTSVPLTGTRIGVKSFHKETTFDFKISFNADPTKQEEFQTKIADTLNTGRTGEQFTDQINYSSFGAKVGQVATIQIASKDNHVRAFRCVDVKFI